MPHQCTDCGTTFADGSTEMLSGCPDCGGNTFQFLPESGANGSDPAPQPGSESAPATESKPNAGTESTDERSNRSTPGDSVAKTVGNAAKTVRDIVASDPDEPGTSPEAADPLEPWPADTADVDDTDPADPTESSGSETPPTGRDRPREDSATSDEDIAQTSARSAVVTSEELPESGAAEISTGGQSPADHPTSSDTADGESTAESTDADGTDSPDLEELRAELNAQFESIRIVEPGQYELNLMELYEREEYIIALQEDGRYRIQVPESWQD
ncbi:OapC/ArvC family zinc-ribbon domain-containing protein [Halorhabdus rudnickae]|uniref:OapC/ArvC family zinc-ribbon domain-containing protein n=1 Tax=Halorhabdus rudnickae TaxID=1775544 RepID=UPI001083D87C|nr:Zn-ribbon containing protein [Halorhabdus rudnickae]